MKLAISNIAWTRDQDGTIEEWLPSYGVKAIEIAPTRLWSDWHYDNQGVANVQQQLQHHGLSCSSLQAILFGKPDLQLFGTTSEKAALAEHLKQVADLAAELGAIPLVFGAPKNRDTGSKDYATAFAEAIEFFAAIGDYFHQRGVCLCIEPNPTVYGCNFITNSQEGAALVRAVNSPGFRLHLDAAGMYLAGEDPAQAIEAAADVLVHLHISEPNLGNFANPEVPHRSIAKTLRAIDWNRWVAIEMRATEQPVASIQQALETVAELYELS